MNVSCDSNENICEATITITFPCKQTIMKHDMDKFNPTQIECRIPNLVVAGRLQRRNASLPPIRSTTIDSNPQKVVKAGKTYGKIL